MSRGWVRTRSYACSFTNAVVVRDFFSFFVSLQVLQSQNNRQVQGLISL